MALQLTLAHLDQMRAHARREAPCECCGILVGRRTPDGRDVLEVLAVANTWEGDRHTRFMVDPKAHLRAQREARERRLEIVGFYHSHPEGFAEPSAFDTELAWPEHSYVIVAIDGGTGSEIRSWIWDSASEAFTEEPLRIASVEAS